jgi:hypothetical protein
LTADYYKLSAREDTTASRQPIIETLLENTTFYLSPIPKKYDSKHKQVEKQNNEAQTAGIETQATAISSTVEKQNTQPFDKHTKTHTN